ncbi:hypothetical protein LTR36_008002 [Oleoguttula mirabilis]|uniref:Uncharacterized protein n=1 Tax=Oleoguttula mirabilis TaxID=1507867 RepID=A0AAV9J8T6_9PEZI|nr:hypothetical protein LTR36_008002 [Oleoguttula mirabilis]
MPRIVSHHLWQRAGSAFIDGIPADARFPKDNSPAGPASNYTFYLKELPPDLLVCAPLTLLAYKWQCWLERTFPGRPRGNQNAIKQAGEKEEIAFSDDEQLEEEIMRKLIAKGKVRRSSISWCNTLMKWFIDNTFGVLFFASATRVLSDALKLHLSSNTWSGLRSVSRVALYQAGIAFAAVGCVH